MENKELIEDLASMEHARWSRWQEYLHSKCMKNPDGSLTIPSEFVIRWERQISTPYSQLSEREKESDRKEVRPYIELAVLADEQGYMRGSLDTADKLSQWLEHDRQCIISQFSQGEPTSDGGYRQMYAGKWYQTKPIDESPKCDCGLDQSYATISKRKENV